VIEMYNSLSPLTECTRPSVRRVLHSESSPRPNKCISKCISLIRWRFDYVAPIIYSINEVCGRRINCFRRGLVLFIINLLVGSEEYRRHTLRSRPQQRTLHLKGGGCSCRSRQSSSPSSPSLPIERTSSKERFAIPLNL